MTASLFIKALALFMPIFTSINWVVILLLKDNSGNKARVLLGYFMFLSCLFYIGSAFYFLGWWKTYVHYDPVSDVCMLSFFPAYYQYIRLLTVDKNWNRGYLVHYIPAVVYGLITFIAHYIYHNYAHENSEQYFIDNLFSVNIWNNPLVPVILLERVFFAVQVFFYLTLGIRLIKTYHQRVRNFYSNMGNRDIQWVSLLLYSFLAAALISLLFNLTGRSVMLHESWFLLIPSLLCSLVLFIIGYAGNAQNQVVIEIQPEKTEEVGNESGYARQKMVLQEKLEKLFKVDKIYLSPELTIWDVSMGLATNRTYVSQLINENYRMNFSRYVNQYRVEDAKALLKRRDMDQLSLDTIGEQCGFGTQNNFIRVFRLFENTTPGKFREQHMTEKPGLRT
jgi:AraC-like DNA-binding protein